MASSKLNLDGGLFGTFFEFMVILVVLRHAYACHSLATRYFSVSCFRSKREDRCLCLLCMRSI